MYCIKVLGTSYWYIYIYEHDEDIFIISYSD